MTGFKAVTCDFVQPGETESQAMDRLDGQVKGVASVDPAPAADAAPPINTPPPAPAQAAAPANTPPPVEPAPAPEPAPEDEPSPLLSSGAAVRDMDDAQLVDALLRNREAEDAMKARHSREKADLGSDTSILKNEAIRRCDEAGEEKISAPGTGTSIRKLKRYYAPDGDHGWDDFLEYCKTNGHMDLISRSAFALRKMDAYVQDRGGQLPPGVKCTREYDIETRKARS